METGKINPPEILLPPILVKAFGHDSELRREVEEGLALLAEWTQGVHLPLLKEFNDHSHKHIAVVLENATNLIAEETRDTITADEAAVLALAAGLHDAAMHLDHDDLVGIILRNHPGVPALGDRPWRELWEEHIRWYRQMDPEDARAKLELEDPLILSDFELSSSSRNALFFQGDFVRKHHHRIAQEFAEFGLPARQSGKPPPSVHVSFTFVRQLAGLVARSHGEPLRKHVDHLLDLYKSEFRQPHGVRAVFLMALVRVGDYLHIGQDRARARSRIFFPVSSRIARREWDINHAVVRDYPGDPDTESQHFEVEPSRVTDVSRYLRLRDYFRDLQAELDTSWIEIGSAFGAKGPELALRRVKTNLETEIFQRELPFVAEESGVRVSGPDVVNLLIEPLYGENIYLGMRELQQNALDAVLTLRELRRQEGGPVADAPSDPPFGIEIAVEEAAGQTFVQVTDTGIGMDFPTIRDYFLVAGTSYARSPEWRNRFQDAAGHNLIARRGKFGVGFLAAFLLGDEIEVTTRRYGAGEGYRFTLHKHDLSHTEVRRIAGNDLPPVGTRICIRASDRVVGDLRLAQQNRRHWEEAAQRFDWPLQRAPSSYGDLTVRWIGTDDVAIRFRSEREAFETAAWHPLHASRYWRTASLDEELQSFWSLGTPTDAVDAGCSLNGVWVQSVSGWNIWNTHNPRLTLTERRLEISLVDPQNRLPINLARTEIVFDDFVLALDESLLRDIVARLLFELDSREGKPIDVFNDLGKVLHRVLLPTREGWFIRGKDKSLPCMAKMWFCPMTEGTNTNYNLETLPGGAIMSLEGFTLEGNVQIAKHFSRLHLSDRPISGRRSIACPIDDVKLVLGDGSAQSSSPWIEVIRMKEAQQIEEGRAVIEVGKWLKSNGSKDVPFFFAIANGNQSDKALRWERFCGETVIPYNREERQAVLADIYIELAEDIARWRDGFGFLPDDLGRDSLRV